MINPSVKEKIKNIVHKHFKFDDNGNLIKDSNTPDASFNAMKEIYNIVMGENND